MESGGITAKTIYARTNKMWQKNKKWEIFDHGGNYENVYMALNPQKRDNSLILRDEAGMLFLNGSRMYSPGGFIVLVLV